MDSEVIALNPSLEALQDEVWALQPAVLRQVRAFLAGDTSVRAALTRTPTQPRTQGIVSIIPIQGMIERRSSLLSELFGGTSVESVRQSLRAALADPEVRGIILNVDSPGGGVAGITELAEEIRAARGVKPIVAVVDTVGASAAYWLASQASQVLVTRSGQVGSIGIFGIHMDVSGALAKEGVTATIISAGEHKVDESEYVPLTEEARAAIQARTDTFYAQFVGDVAKGRGIPTDKVKADYGQGAVLLADAALRAGMVDGIGTIDTALRDVGRLARRLGADADVVELEASDEPHPFRERVAALQAEALSLAEHARVRADLRSKEGRAPFSDPILASLRSTRDAIAALLPVEPAPAPPAVEPPPVKPVTPAATKRPLSQDEWLRFLDQARSH